jgi:RHS repeat-associated protein
MVRSYEEDTNGVNEYTYSDAGIRVKSHHYKTINGGAKQNEETKIFLIDVSNHTGYAQVLVVDDDSNETHYIIGHDVLTQPGSSLRYFVYDGHGSVRQLSDSMGALVSGQTFKYDAYANLVNSVTPDTSLLYSGEMWDDQLQQYYLRARWYDPVNGRFNRMDPFQGSTQDPQSLHKYLYTHCNPTNNMDPTGQFSLSEVTTVTSTTSLLMKIGFPIVDYVTGGGVHRFIPQWVWDIIDTASPDAFSFGAGANVGWSGFNVTGGLELPKIKSFWSSPRILVSAPS